MAKYTTNKKSRIITDNVVVQKEKNLNSIQVYNNGTDTVVIDDNIELEPDATFSWDNHPDVTIDQDIIVKFKKIADKTQNVLFVMFYIKEA